MIREEAIRLCEDFIKNHSDWSVEEEWAKGVEYVLEDYKRSTHQEPKTGYWIEHEHNGIAYIECSECSTWFLRAHLIRNTYCPNCGKKMEREE